jgi:hypothetical protein
MRGVRNVSSKTHGCDMVLEVSQETYQNLIGVMIDAGSFASQLIGKAAANYWNTNAKGLPQLRFNLCTFQ